MSILFKGIKLVLTLAFIALAVGVAYVALPQFGNQALIVRSGSMTPTIDVGSIVVVRPTASGILSPLSSNTVLYNPGDIIAFRSEKNSKTIITHRITEVLTGEEGIAYKTKGDANKAPDGWTVDAENILGRSYITIPSAGKLLAFAKSDIGFPTLIILPAVIVILIELINIIKEVRKKRRGLTTSNQEQTLEPTSMTTSWADLITDRTRVNSPFVLIKKSLFGGTKTYNITGLKILIPFLLFGLVIPNTFAMYADTETSVDNIFQAADDFTDPQTEPEEPTVNPGDVVINEIMWMGTQGDAADEWIELRNMTGDTIDISGWEIVNLATGPDGAIVIPDGQSIAPNGFFLIANDPESTSAVSINPDVVSSSVSLLDPSETLTLQTADDVVIDIADNDANGWFAGQNGTGQNPERSMERNDIPGDGTVAGNWHTATTATNIDLGNREIATPKAANSTP